MRKLEKIWVIGIVCAMIGVICTVVCGVCNFYAAIIPCLAFAGIASYVAVAAIIISEKRKSYGIY